MANKGDITEVTPLKLPVGLYDDPRRSDTAGTGTGTSYMPGSGHLDSHPAASSSPVVTSNKGNVECAGFNSNLMCDLKSHLGSGRVGLMHGGQPE
jgi:hypothetical protein